MKKILWLGALLLLFGCGQEQPKIQTWSCSEHDDDPDFRVDFENLRVQAIYKNGKRPLAMGKVEFTDEAVFFDQPSERGNSYVGYELNFNTKQLKIRFLERKDLLNLSCSKING